MSEDVLPVSPDDVETIRALLREGKPVVFDVDAPGLIQAEWLRDLVDPIKKEITQDIVITNAILDGELDLKVITFLGEVSLFQVIFRDALKFDRAKFSRELHLMRCSFREVLSLQGAFVYGDLFLADSVAEKTVSINELHITGSLLFQRTQVHGEFNALDLIIDGGLFATRANFWDAVWFLKAKITGTTFLDGATFQGKVRFSGAHFGGGVHFQGARFHRDASFREIECKGSITFSNNEDVGPAIFYTDLTFEDSFFRKDISFRDVYIGGMGSWRKITCLGLSDFTGAWLAGDASFFAAHFKESAIFDGVSFCGNVDFERAIFEQALFARRKDSRLTRFARNVDFAYVHCGSVTFEGTEFRSSATFHRAVIDTVASFPGCQFFEGANFSEFRVGDALILRPDGQAVPVIFFETANFSQAGIQGWARFDGTKFLGPAYFTDIDVRDSIDLRDAEFHKNVRFDDATIGGDTKFGVLDSGESPPQFHASVSFVSAKFYGWFMFAGVKTARRANFIGARFDGPANFRGSRFNIDTIDGAEDFTSFAGAKFRSDVSFSGAEFRRSAIFDFSEANQLLDFRGVTFRNELSFQDASFNFVYFAEDNSSKKRVLKGGFGSLADWCAEKIFPTRPTTSPVESKTGQFGGVVDLRGMNVDRIYVDWQELFSQQIAFDRQPYAELEAAYRRIGEDELAKDVYYARRIKDLSRTFGRIRGLSGIVQAGMELFRWGIAGYGVRPARFFVILVGFFGAGIGIYAMPGAATLRAASVNPSTTSPNIDLSLRDSFFVSLDHLLPSPVEIFAARNWIPTDHVLFRLVGIDVTSARFATVQGILAWIFIPTLIVIIGKALWRPID